MAAAIDAQDQPGAAAGAAADGIFVSAFEQGEIGPDLFPHACLMGLEGLVSKHRESVYRGGRYDRWIKVKNRQHPAFSRVMDQFELAAKKSRPKAALFKSCIGSIRPRARDLDPCATGDTP